MNKQAIAEDVKVANNLRARRRRYNRRRNARRRANRGGARGRVRFNSAQQVAAVAEYNHALEKENKEEEKHENVSPLVKVKLSSVISPSLVKFCEAVVHPFGNDSIGAILPDQYQDLIIPMCDRLELDITPSVFNASGNWETDTRVQLTGIFAWFQPRTISTGTLLRFDDGGISYPKWPAIPLDSTLSTELTDVMMDAYTLCITGIWTSAHTDDPNVTYGVYDPAYAAPLDTVIKPVFLQVQYSRFATIEDNIDKLRVLGAGLKMWAESAPINTGGYSVGGWITLEDIQDAMSWTTAATTPGGAVTGPATPGALKAIQPSIKYACRTQGIKGSTVRYSPLQTQQQLESETPKVGSRYYTESVGAFALPAVVPRTSADLAVHDLANPGTFVPCIYWAFNPTPENTESSVYTIKLMSMVHSEGTPTGQCPFMSSKINVDPSAHTVKTMLENKEVFPVATSGHSFRSFMSKANRVFAKVLRGASHISNMLALTDSFLQTY